MNHLFDFLEGGSVQLQNKKKITVYSILITLAAIILVLAILLVSSVVLAIQNKPEEENSDPDGDGIPTGFVTTEGLRAGSTNLMLLDNNHLYTGEAPATILMRNSENRAFYMVDGVKKYAYTIGGTETLSGTAESLTALNNMLQAFYDANGDDNLYISTAHNPFATNQNVIYATGETYELDYYPDYENDSSKQDSIYGVSTYTWIYQNAYKYGFVALYPVSAGAEEADTEQANIFRYVGIPHATYMNSKNLSLTEYLDFIKTKTVNAPLSLKDGYKAYYIAGGATQIVPEAERYDYTVSADNAGGLVVTFKKK